MPQVQDIDPALLRRLLRYDPDTGKLFWRDRQSSDFGSSPTYPADARLRHWQKCFAGREALYSINSCGYKQGRVLRRAFTAHRVAWAIAYGEWPDRIDHINGVRTDNRLANLRSVSSSVNNRNKCLPRNNKSGRMGVRWAARDRRWCAVIRVDGKDRYLGNYTSKEAAIAARAAAEVELGFHPNHGRQAQ
jgi:hypothetical protein